MTDKKRKKSSSIRLAPKREATSAQNRSAAARSSQATAKGGAARNSGGAASAQNRSAAARSSQASAKGGAVRNSGGAAVAEQTGRQVTGKSKKKKWIRSGFDYPLFTIVMILLAFGMIMMFSASYATAYNSTGDSLYYVKRQLIFAVGGIIAMLLLSSLDYHIFQNKVILRIIVLVSAGLMLLVKLMGTTQGGAERWLQIGEITFQPSEILKFAVIIYFAYLTEKKFSKITDFKKGFLPFAVALAISCGLLIMQPHLSGTIIVFAIGFSMMYVAGVNKKHLLLMLLGLTALVVIGVLLLQAMGYDYFTARIQSWQNPESDTQKNTFQTYQSLVAIGSGGMFGLGFGNSRQKYGYLPASRNDFVFSIICEELGFVGAMLVIILFLIFVFRGFYISSHARDKFGSMVAFGITLQIGLQALLNIAVVTNSIPNTGISLPFFSYGGTALMMQLAEMGILLSISRKAELE